MPATCARGKSTRYDGGGLARQYRQTYPFRFGQLTQYAACATRRAAPGKQRVYASALGIDRTRACRHMNGDDAGSPAAAFLLSVDSLARHPNTSPWPIIAEAAAVAVEAGVDTLEPANLVERWRKLCDEMPRLMSDEECAKAAVAWTGDVLPLSDADLHGAEVRLERAAIARRLAELEINPLTYGRK